MICVDMNINITKSKHQTSTSRDLRKVRINPQLFLKQLSNIEWGNFVNFEDVDEMEEFWTSKINQCLDYIAPWKTRKIKQKKFCLPKVVYFCLPKVVNDQIKKLKELQKRHRINKQNGKNRSLTS